jgi:hypothetical protein
LISGGVFDLMCVFAREGEHNLHNNVELQMVELVRMGWAIRTKGRSFHLFRCPFCQGEDAVTFVASDGRTSCNLCGKKSVLNEVAERLGFESKDEVPTVSHRKQPHRLDPAEANATAKQFDWQRPRGGRKPSVARIVK